MPHRKWRLEFNTNLFPNSDQLTADSKQPLTNAYRLSDIFTLTGTSERAVLMTLPIIGRDGTVYGIQPAVQAGSRCIYNQQRQRKYDKSCRQFQLRYNGRILFIAERTIYFFFSRQRADLIPGRHFVLYRRNKASEAM